MEKLAILLIFLTKFSLQIISPEDESYQKPITYTSGIKTFSYRKPSQLQFHHNYSRVFHQNGHSANNFHEEQHSRPHPIYRPPQRPVYVINGSRIGKNENPTRQVVIYNKSKRTPKVEIYRVCPRDATGQFVYESSCNQFLNCWKGRGVVQNCAPGTLFNPKTLECDFPEKVQCISGPRHVLEKSAKIVKQIGCPRDFSGLIPNYTDCSKFINCVSGIENFMDCPHGTLFDVDKNICDFAHKAACFNRQNQKDRQEDGSRSGQGCHRCYSQETGHLSYKSNEIRCPDGVVGLHKHPTDCSKFLNCANGLTYVQDCSPGTLFNPSLKICDFPYNVRCDNQYQPGVSTHHSGGTSGYEQQHYDGETGYNQKQHSTGDHLGYNQGQHGTISHHGSDQYNREHSGYNQKQHGAVNQYNRDTSGYHQQQYGTADQSHRYASGYNQQHGCQGCHGTDSQHGYQQQYHGTIDQGNSDSSGYSHHKQQYYGTGDPNSRDTSGYSQQHHSTVDQYSREPSVYNEQHHTIDQYSREPSGYNQQHHTIDQYSRKPSVYNQQHHSSGVYSSTPVYQQHYNKGIKIHSSSGYHYQNQYGSSTPHYQSSSNQYDSGSKIYSTTDDQFEENQGGWDQNSYSKGYVDPNQQTGGFYHNGVWQSASKGSVGIYHKPTSTYHNQEAIGINHRGETGIYRDGDPYQDPSYRSKGTYGSTTSTYGSSNWGQSTTPQSGYNRYNHQGRYPDTGTNWNPKPAEQPGGYHRPSGWRQPEDDEVTANYDQVVNINHVTKTTRKPYYVTTARRNSYQPFYGTTEKHRYISSDYDDTFGSGSTPKRLVTTPRAAEVWPPPFPSTDVNADYVFEYDDGDEVTLEAENSLKNERKDGACGKSHFRCSVDHCIPKTLVCNGAKDCASGSDELKCLENVSKFSVEKNRKLAILEQERWDNVSIATCALLCVEARFRCKSFNYRKLDRTCFLTDTNEGLTGALISYQPCDYYELISEKIDCSSKYSCPNNKCINRSQLCDGNDDCGDRTDEKNCKVQDFGYSIKLTGSKHTNEGRLEVTAFGRTGYVCDDNFGLRDAEVACRELGFHLGAVEVKGNSFFAKNITTDKPFYMMDDVSCLGNETKLMDCDFSGWGVHNCLNQEIVGVVCKTPHESCPDNYWKCDTGDECIPLLFLCDGLLDCKDGSDEAAQHCDAPTQIRLVNGTGRNEGRVEIRHHGTWGTICDDDFNEDAAKVVCRQLGYKGSSEARKEGFFGAGNGPIWLDQVFCSGNETSIERCSHWNWGEHNCEHGEDVGVICRNIYEVERHAVVSMPKIPQDYPTGCGFRNNIFGRDDGVHMRVVASSVARRGDYPWQAAIRVKAMSKPTHWCGAVIISENFVLTAAHCLLGYPKGAYIIAAGDYDMDEYEGSEQEAFIEDYYLHEDFRKGHKMNNDIALVKLKGRGFRFDQNIQPICLPEKNTVYEQDHNCTISGFGSTDSGKSAYSHTLRAGWIPIQKREICTMPHVYGDELKEGMFCAGELDGGTDGCRGDSGGPLACLNKGVFTLYGITSWGHHCGYANKPGVYVKVAHYRKWIDEKFQKYSG